MAYAARALTLIVQFWELTNKANSLNILFVLVGYILMHTSSIHLFFSARALGSNLKLSVAILSSSILAFTLALPISHYLEISLDPISLTEALLFFVHVVGFDKPLCLVAAMRPAGEVLMEATENSCNAILRDYALEIQSKKDLDDLASSTAANGHACSGQATPNGAVSPLSNAQRPISAALSPAQFSSTHPADAVPKTLTDPWFSGEGPNVPRPNRPKVLARRLRGSSSLTSSLTSASSTELDEDQVVCVVGRGGGVGWAEVV
ncbi:uncharacterized protein EDB91DRAFT_1244866 [Suillus paluster]|uniref:uncharacterized protein n=1 Tax=Suillus paluster TaxID=48578 RepID=UPI001B86300A|nr:uncharacterized protein EDB91DRAFT_1244866 [Suillus paluster]KAG1749071.1 hypothetical protein EDB91DRAFT_1244866 [Suillus paluster]